MTKKCTKCRVTWKTRSENCPKCDIPFAPNEMGELAPPSWVAPLATFLLAYLSEWESAGEECGICLKGLPPFAFEEHEDDCPLVELAIALKADLE